MDTCGIPYTYSLPLLTPIPGCPHPLLLKLNDSGTSYLVVSAEWKGHKLTDKYHMLRVIPAAFLPNDVNGTIPKAFLKIESLFEIDSLQAFNQLTGIVSGNLSSIF